MDDCKKIEVRLKNNVIAHLAAAAVVGLLVGGAIWWSTKYYVDHCCPKKDCGCDAKTTDTTDTPKTTRP